jgi:hypothetical protein
VVNQCGLQPHNSVQGTGRSRKHASGPYQWILVLAECLWNEACMHQQ